MFCKLTNFYVSTNTLIQLTHHFRCDYRDISLEKKTRSETNVSVCLLYYYTWNDLRIVSD